MDSVILTTLVTTIGGTATYFIGKNARRSNVQKTDEEIDALRLSNLRSTIDIYKIVHNELSEQLEMLRQECIKLRSEISILREENVSLKQEIHLLNSKFQK